MRAAAYILFVLACQSCQPCQSRSIDEDSVVSVYTTLPTTRGPHPPLDVYRQIASNIAERITSPIYRFLGIGRNRTDEKFTRRVWEKIEILDDASEEATQASYLPVDNDISEDRDIEELSVEALKKVEGKPEKLTLYSSYLPVKGNLEEDINTSTTVNPTSGDDDDDDSFTLDDVENDSDDRPREGYFAIILELLSSLLQLAWGGLTALFRASGNNNASDNGDSSRL